MRIINILFQLKKSLANRKYWDIRDDSAVRDREGTEKGNPPWLKRNLFACTMNFFLRCILVRMLSLEGSH